MRVVASFETTTVINFLSSFSTTISLLLLPLNRPPSSLTSSLPIFAFLLSLTPYVLANSYFMMINLHAQNMLRLRCWPDRFHVTLLLHRKMTSSFCQHVR